MNKCNEIWKDVAGYEGLYMVSNHGNVKRMPEYSLCNGVYSVSRKGRVIAKSKDYRRAVTFCHNNKIKRTSISILVLTTFKGDRPKGFDASHIDGDYHNNHIDNLIWESRSNNLLRKRDHGTSSIVGRSGNTPKLDHEKADRIRYLFTQGFTQIEIGEIYNVDNTLVSKIVNNKRWVRKINK
jgi:hypothetical protein